MSEPRVGAAPAAGCPQRSTSSRPHTSHQVAQRACVCTPLAPRRATPDAAHPCVPPSRSPAPPAPPPAVAECRPAQRAPPSRRCACEGGGGGRGSATRHPPITPSHVLAPRCWLTWWGRGGGCCCCCCAPQASRAGVPAEMPAVAQARARLRERQEWTGCVQGFALAGQPARVLGHRGGMGEGGPPSPRSAPASLLFVVEWSGWGHHVSPQGGRAAARARGAAGVMPGRRAVGGGGRCSPACLARGGGQHAPGCPRRARAQDAAAAPPMPCPPALPAAV